MKRLNVSVCAIMTLVALMFTACAFEPPDESQKPVPQGTTETGDPSQAQGTVSFRIAPVSATIYSALKSPVTSARSVSSRAYMGVDKVSFELALNGTVVDSWDQLVAGSAPGNAIINSYAINTRTVSVGSGYVLKAKVFNYESSQTIPVVIGESSPFDVTTSTDPTLPQQNVSITCVPPFNPDNPAEFLTIALAENSVHTFQSVSPWYYDGTAMQVTTVGSEQWFRATPTTYWTAFSAGPINAGLSAPVVLVYDADGVNVGVGSTDGAVGTAIAYVPTVPGSTYYFCVVDFAFGAPASSRNMAVSYQYQQYPPIEEALGPFDVYNAKTIPAYQPKLFYFDVYEGDTVTVWWDDAWSGSGTYSEENGGVDIRVYGYLADKSTAWFGPGDNAYLEPYISYTATTTGRLYLYAESFVAGEAGAFAIKVDYAPYVQANRAPNAFDLTYPANSAMLSAYPISLGWNATTDPDGDAVTYEVYCGLTNPPTTKIATTSLASYAITTGLTTHYATYYWLVKAIDGKGGITTSTSTRPFYKYFGNSPPSAPALLTPTAGATNVSRNPTLTWTAATDPDGDALTYKVYLEAYNTWPTTVVASGVTGTSYTVSSNLIADYQYYWRVEAVDPSNSATSSTARNFWTGSTLSHYLANYTFQQSGWSDWPGTYTSSSDYYNYMNMAGGGDYVPNWTFTLDPNYLYNGPIDVDLVTTAAGADPVAPNAVFMADLNNNYNGYGMRMSQNLPATGYATLTSTTKLKLRFKIMSYAGGAFYSPYYEAPIKVFLQFNGAWYLFTGYTISPYGSVAAGEVVPANSWIERDLLITSRAFADGYYASPGMQVQAVAIDCNGWAWQVLVDTVDLHE